MGGVVPLGHVLPARLGLGGGGLGGGGALHRSAASMPLKLTRTPRDSRPTLGFTSPRTSRVSDMAQGRAWAKGAGPEGKQGGMWRGACGGGVPAERIAGPEA